MPSVKTMVMWAQEAFYNVERSNMEIQWTRMSEFIMPSQSGVFREKHAIGSPRNRRLYDPTAITANNELASAMQATVINEATNWFKLRYTDEELQKDKESSIWLEASNKKILKALSDSNFYFESGKMLHFLSGLGSGILHHEEKKPNSPEFSGFRFKCLHLANVAWSENQEGIADKIFHKHKMTIRQIREKFKTLPERLVEVEKKSPEQKERILMVVCPMAGGDGDTDGDDHYTISYIHVESNTLLKEIVSKELMEYVVRWSTLPEEVYGRSPAHDAYPTIRSLNIAVREGMQSKALFNRPPILVEDQNVLTTIDLRPGHKTTVNNIDGIKPFISGASIQGQQLTEKDFQSQIKSIFLIDKLMLPPRETTGEMTAYEVARRIEQMQKVIGGVASRLDVEWLQPLITRSFRMMYEKGALGEAPEKVRQSGGLDIHIAFDNPLSRSQKFEEISNVQQWLAMVEHISRIDPNAPMSVATEEMVEGTSKALGVPESYVRSSKQVQQLLLNQQQSQQRQQGLEQMNMAADIAQKQAGGQ